MGDHTIRIARLKLSFIAAKVATHSGATEVKYSRHDSRVAGLFRFLEETSTSVVVRCDRGGVRKVMAV